MHKVANKAIIRKISFRTMQEKRGKNMIAIIAIGLTSLLFTALFTVGGSMIESMQEATMRQVGTSAHGGYQYMTAEEYESIKNDPQIKDISYDIIVGFAVNPEVSETQTEVRYGEDKAAKWGFSYPEAGDMPRAGKECAVSTKTLDELGLPHQLGIELPVQIQIDQDIVIEEVFTLSGYWEADKASRAQQFWVSREWLEEHVEIKKVNFYEDMNNNLGNASGYLQAAIFFSSSYNIEKQVHDLTIRSGLDPQNTNESVNWAYGMASVDGMTVMMAVLLLLIIAFSGYLIIYNIFYINVTADIRYYGLLKTVGTTGRQLRSMVRRQAFLLSCAGIPLGLLCGFLLGRGILPAVYNAINTSGVKKVTINPWIFVGAAAFSLLVVYISCIRPCKLAAGVSPIEAVRYVEQSSCKKKRKRSQNINMWKLAFANMGRNRKKTVVVIASLSLSLILLNSTITLIGSFDFNLFINSYLLEDYQVTSDGVVNFAVTVDNDYESITPEILEELRAIDGVAAADTLFVCRRQTVLFSEGRERFRRFIDKYGDTIENRKWWEPEAGLLMETGEAWANIYGIHEDMLSYLTVRDGEIDLAKWRNGGYIICAGQGGILAEDRWVQVGDKITYKQYLTEEQGTETIQAEVMAIVDIPYAMSTRSYPGRFADEYLMNLDDWKVLEEAEFNEEQTVQGGLHAFIQVEPDKEEQLGAALEEYVEQVHPELTLISKNSLREDFAANTNMFGIIGGVLSLILALIGILNFINAVITGILARKQEFAMMEAVGMTGKQLRAMLIYEGLFYGGMTVLFSLTIGNLIGYTLVWTMGQGMAFFTWHFTMLPILISIPVLIVISVIVPIVCYYCMCRRSVVERLRLAEI